MRILKFIGLGLLALVALLLVAALFVSKDYRVEREVVINKPVSEVFAYVKLLKNQHNWSTWTMMDPKMTSEFRGTDGTIGFVSGWKGDPNNVGTGEQEIKKITEGSRIDYEIRFLEPMVSTSPVWLTTDSIAAGQTRVVWGMSGHTAYPMNLMMSLMGVSDFIGAEYQKSLGNLKGILEKQ